MTLFLDPRQGDDHAEPLAAAPADVAGLYDDPTIVGRGRERWAAGRAARLPSLELVGGEQASVDQAEHQAVALGDGQAPLGLDRLGAKAGDDHATVAVEPQASGDLIGVEAEDEVVRPPLQLDLRRWPDATQRAP